MSGSMSEQQLAEIADLIGGANPARDSVLIELAESVRDRLTHDHATQREDWYCMNLTAFMGERMGPVLRRLLDAEAELTKLRSRIAELADYERLSPQQCPKGLHADWLVDSEYAHACPWCRVAELEAGPVEQTDDASPAVTTRQCGHDDYHDAHEWADKPHVWCPGHSYETDAEVTS